METIEQLTLEINRLNELNSGLEDECNSLRSNYEDSKRRVDKLERENSRLENEISNKDNEIYDKDREISGLEREKDSLERERDDLDYRLRQADDEISDLNNRHYQE